MFKKEKPSIPEAHAPMGRGADAGRVNMGIRPATLIERLELQRQSKEAEFAKLYGELRELDEVLARLRVLRKVDPGIEELVEKARER